MVCSPFLRRTASRARSSKALASASAVAAGSASSRRTASAGRPFSISSAACCTWRRNWNCPWIARNWADSGKSLSAPSTISRPCDEAILPSQPVQQPELFLQGLFALAGGFCGGHRLAQVEQRFLIRPALQALSSSARAASKLPEPARPRASAATLAIASAFWRASNSARAWRTAPRGQRLQGFHQRLPQHADRILEPAGADQCSPLRTRRRACGGPPAPVPLAPAGPSRTLSPGSAARSAQDLRRFVELVLLQQRPRLRGSGGDRIGTLLLLPLLLDAAAQVRQVRCLLYFPSAWSVRGKRLLELCLAGQPPTACTVCAPPGRAPNWRGPL